MRKQTVYLGIDPGASGAIAALEIGGEVVSLIKNSETPADVAAWLREQVSDKRAYAFLEKVHAMPKQGVSSTFKFGQSYGFLVGLLVANQVQYHEVTPQVWQREMHCLSQGDKNRTKQAAQARFPLQKVTHAIADALLIADLCRNVAVYKSQPRSAGCPRF